MCTGPGGGADALGEQRDARLVGREPPEDARRADVIELAELRAVGQRAQLGVVDQYGPTQAEAQRVDDLLKPSVHRWDRTYRFSRGYWRAPSARLRDPLAQEEARIGLREPVRPGCR